MAQNRDGIGLEPEPSDRPKCLLIEGLLDFPRYPES
jgi:hypothetical protein